MPNFASADAPSRPKPAGLVTIDGRTFPLRAARLKAAARGGFAATTLIQEYANPYAEPLEVLYTMPLPADGAVVGYTFRLGERVVRGEIERREKAVEDYRQALMEGKTAGLLEQERADTFSQSLGNVPGGAEVVVEIEVLHPLSFLPGVLGVAPLWEWRFPTVVGVRYQGAPGVVSDAERLDVPRAEAGTPVRVDAELTIDDGRKLAVAGRLDQDVVLTWSAAREEVDARLIEGRGLPGDDGRYAILTITPPVVVTEAMARDLTILLDASGSMDGRPMAAAKAVVDELLSSLRPGDRFELLAFSNDVRRLTAGMVTVDSRAVASARERLHALRAGGGTEMVGALEAALPPLREEAQRQVVLLTDGYIGVEEKVRALIRNRLPVGSRLHVVGVGSAPNRTLTRGASRAGRGLEVLVGLEDDVRAAAERLVRGTAAPVLTEVTVGGGAVSGIAPAQPRDVFAGAPMSVFVELIQGAGVVEVSGRLAGSPEPWKRSFEVPLALRDEAGIPVGALYGRERVEDVEASGEWGLDSSIETLGLRHRIVTRCTSLVAISEDPTVDPRNPRRRERLAVELPFGVSAEGVGLGDHRSLARGFHRALVAAPSMDDLEEGAFSEGREFNLTERLPQRVRVRGRLISFDAGSIVIEFEVPEPTLEIIEGRLALVQWEDHSWRGATSTTKDHTRPGLYSAGLTVRIGFVLIDPPKTPSRPVALRWLAVGGGAELEVSFD